MEKNCEANGINNLRESNKREENFLRIYQLLGSFQSLNFRGKYPHVNAKGMEKQEKLNNYIKVLVKCFYEAKYSFAMAEQFYNSGINIENQSFGFAGYVIFGERQEPFFDPVIEMNNELSAEWFMGYYSNMAILRSYAFLDMSGGLLNFLLLLAECKPGRPGKFFDKYVEDFEKLISTDQIKNKNYRYFNIDDFLDETMEAKEIYLKHKKYYNNIKHNYDNYIELDFTKRTRPVDLYAIVKELFTTVLQYFNNIIKFIKINIDEIIPSYDQIAISYNPQAEHLNAYMKAQNMDETYKKYIIQII